ncbi:MAG: DUF4055 domain-containing protein [Pseudomonadota bacterium]
MAGAVGDLTSVAAPSDAYNEALDLWCKCRDVALGEEAVQAAGERYLPRLGGQDLADYDAYRRRAGFYNATRRTIDGLAGLIFRKSPVVSAPAAAGAWLADIDLAGTPFARLAETVVEEVLTVTRVGLLVDMPRATDEIVTRADAAQSNMRPFARAYRAEDILDLRLGQRGNATVITQVRLRESVAVPASGDEFGQASVDQIRVLDLDEEGYRQRLYRPGADGAWRLADEIRPLKRGRPLGRIPFFPIGARGLTPEIDRPLLLDLINLNLSHYRTLADLEHGAHFVALPTPYVFGVDDDYAPTSVGPTELWHSPDKDVTVGLLEFTGQGLEGLERRREAKEAQMAALGARMLAPEKRQAEAAETLALRTAGEASILAALANGAGQALTAMLTTMLDWGGLSGEASVTLNRDFTPAPMSAQELAAWMAALQGGGVSRRTFFEALKQGELVRDDLSFEQEAERLVGDGVVKGEEARA